MIQLTRFECENIIFTNSQSFTKCEFFITTGCRITLQMFPVTLDILVKMTEAPKKGCNNTPHPNPLSEPAIYLVNGRILIHCWMA